MKSGRPVQLVPSADRLATSLRNLGYEFPAAVADLVDNSVAAGASDVWITARFLGTQSYVLIADNGHGMRRERLVEALRYGAKTDYDKESLGRFGLGLKTASLSQCRHLTVATKTNPKASISAYRWSLDHLEKTDRWEILPAEDELGTDVLEFLTAVGSGTLVVWEQLDRVLEYADPDGAFARKGFLRLCRDLEDYLSMVFHRFLEGSVSRRKLSIHLNNNPVSPWDPFARDQVRTRIIDKATLKNPGGHGRLKLIGYILPTKGQFSPPSAFGVAAGPKGWNLQQGFYIYRNGRLIQSGGWSRLRKADEHTKLARIALDFDRNDDYLFKINVAKMRVQLPKEARNDIESFVRPIIAEANRRYRSQGKSKPSNQGSGKRSKVRDKPEKSEYIDRRFTIPQLRKLLFQSASAKEKPVLEKIFRRFLERVKST